MPHVQNQNISQRLENLTDPTNGNSPETLIQSSSPLSEQSSHTRGALAVHRRKLRSELLRSYVEAQRELHNVEREQDEWYSLLTRLKYERRFHEREDRNARKLANKRLMALQSTEAQKEPYGSSEEASANNADAQVLRLSDNAASELITSEALNGAVENSNNEDVSLVESVVLPAINKSIGILSYFHNILTFNLINPSMSNFLKFSIFIN